MAEVGGEKAVLDRLDQVEMLEGGKQLLDQIEKFPQSKQCLLQLIAAPWIFWMSSFSFLEVFLLIGGLVRVGIHSHSLLDSSSLPVSLDKEGHVSPGQMQL